MKNDNNEEVPGFFIKQATSISQSRSLGNVRGLYFETLTKKKQGQTAPEDLPYIASGNQTDINTPLEAIKELFPHTSVRMPKKTFEHFLF